MGVSFYIENKQLLPHKIILYLEVVKVIHIIDLIILALLFKFFWGIWKRKEYKKNTAQLKKSEKDMESELIKIDNMDERDFEHYCADLLQKNGFTNVSVTDSSGNNGVNIFATKHNLNYAFQCVRQQSKLCNRAVQQIYEGSEYYKCDKAVVLTNNFFTHSAIDRAIQLDVVIWGRDLLTRLIEASQNSTTKTSQKSSTPNIAGTILFLCICGFIAIGVRMFVSTV